MQIRTSIMSLLLLLLLAATASAFQTGPCDNTPECHCKWSEGKRLADCSNQGLMSIPATLSSEIQTLHLDGNPLRKLDKDAFKTVGLLNVQTLSLRHCRIEYLDDNAFRDLKIMTHLDISYNNITKIFPKTFDGNDGLKTIEANHNPINRLVAYQFPPIRSLKTIDLSHCNIAEVDKTSFKNLGQSVESVLLNNNQIQSMREEVFTSLQNLKALSLHSNPWTCDCKLKNFRDFVVNKKLYNRPTMCSEPSRLYNKMWDEISAAEFACKPEIHVPFSRVFGAPGVDATLSCHIMGSPVPHARWVVGGRIVNNNTHPAPLADQTWIIHEQLLTFDGVERWYNLTITNPGLDDLNDYLCVAENNGGVMESRVTLTFDDPSAFAGVIPISDEQLTVIIGASVAVFLLLLLVVLLCCLCFCRKRGKKKGDKVKSSSNGGPDSQKLLSPQQQQMNGSGYSHSTTMITNGGTLPKARSHHNHIDYHNLPQTDPSHSHSHHQLLSYIPGDSYEMEMQDMRQQQMRAPSVISNSNKTSGSTGSNGSDGGRTTASISRASFVDDPHHGHLQAMGPSYPPDLLVIKPTSMSPSMHQLNPAGLIQFTPVTSSPFTRSGTLPLPQHRSLSCDHSNSSSPIPHMIHQHALPVIHHHHHHPSAMPASAGGRPGYVTLPRRPRASWSVPREQPSPSSASLRGAREPIYDGIGPRTSADGSSRLNLNKSQHGAPFATATPPHPGQRFALPPYYAPIEELAECPPTPKVQQSRMQNGLPKSTPNILDLANPAPLPKAGMKQHKPSTADLGTSSSETTLLEENISAYCEPFGKAFIPKDGEEEASKAASKQPGNRNSVTSAESELELVVPVPLPAKKGKKMSTSTPVRQNGDSKMPPPVADKRAPKTLPKPKVKPVPPPKPKKSFGENGNGGDSSCTTPLIAFQDESVEGSEV